jgi:putative DNA primase/helicase
MFDETVTVSEQPMVTILETGPRYDLAAILAAFPTAVSLASALPPASAATEQPNPDDARELSRKAVAYYQEHEPDLWAGRWQDYRDSLSGEKPFPSQSEADYSLCRRIGYWGRDHGVPSAELPLFVETVFSQSALADRDKWRQRKDYRTRTVAKACDGLISPLMQAATSSNCPQGQPDWSLKGDLIAARFFKDLLGERMKFIVSIGKWLRWETDDNQWHWCELGEEVDATKQLVRELLRLTYLRAAEHPDTGQKFINEVSGLQREPRIRAVIELAKSEPGISMKAAKLDAHPELLGVRNGVVDLRTGRLRQVRRHRVL